MPEDETGTVMDQVTATLDAQEKLSPEDKFQKDKELFSKITGEEFNTPKTKKSKPEPKAEEPEEPEEDEPEEKPADPRVVAARKGLAEAGYPEASVQNASDEEALAWYNRHTEQDFDRETAKRQALDLQRRLEDLEKAREPEPEPEPEPVKPDFDGFQKALEDQFGEDASKALGPAFQGLISPLLEENASLRSELKGIKDSWKEAEDRNAKAMTAQNRSRLQSQVPQLENDIAWKAVEDAAGSLMRSGKTYLTADQLFDDAVKGLYGDEVFDKKSRSSDDKKKKIRSAAPTIESRKRAPEPLTAADKQHARDWETFMKTEQRRKAGEYR